MLTTSEGTMFAVPLPSPGSCDHGGHDETVIAVHHRKIVRRVSYVVYGDTQIAAGVFYADYVF